MKTALKFINQILTLVFVFAPLGAAAGNGYPDDLCIQHIRGMACLSVANETSYRSFNANSECSEQAPRKYVNELVNVYLVLPPLLQKTLCALDAFVIVHGHPSIANVFSYRKRDGTPFYGIAFSRRILETKASPTEINTRYEQDLLSFPKSKDKWVRLGQGVPLSVQQQKFSIKVKSDVNVNLLLALIHELGHFVDFMFEMNIPLACLRKAPAESCRSPGEYPWTQLSWAGFEEPSALSGYPPERRLCYYDDHCDPSRNYQNPSEVKGLYEILEKSNFVSHYATAAYDEDFAESLTFYVIQRYFPGSIVQSQVEGKVAYDYLAKIDSEVFTSKRRVLDQVFSQSPLNFRRLIEMNMPLR